MQMSPRPCFAMKLIAFGRHLLGRQRQVALVLAILVVADDDHLAGAKRVDGVFDARERACSSCGLLRSSVVQLIPVFSWPECQLLNRARTTYLPTMSHSRFTRSPTRARAQVRVRPGERHDLHVEARRLELRDRQADAINGDRPSMDRDTARAPPDS